MTAKKNTWMGPELAKDLRALLSLIAAAFLCLLATSASVAQMRTDRPADPIRQPDISSPRGTLSSFLADSEDYLRSWQQIRQSGEDTTVSDVPAFIRAVGTMDFSDTIDGDAWSTKVTRMLMLREVLDRIELPPLEEIPGPEEVAEGQLTQWAIPATNIRIARIETGPRAGGFLFTSATVDELERLYRLARDVPYQPGALEGVFESYMAADDTLIAETARIQDRLKPVDTGSPRSTLEGFLAAVNSAYELAIFAEASLRETPPVMSRAEAKELQIRASNFMYRAVQTLDLSALPEALRDETSIESALLLKEVIDRVPLPPVDAVPGRGDVAALRAQASEGPVQWRLPNTDIMIAEITDGERDGEFLFSAGTVNSAKNFYKKIKDLPYRRSDLGLPIHWRSASPSPGFYEYYATTPGYIIPGAHRLAAWVDRLPDVYKSPYFGQTLWQWLAALGGLFVTAIASYLLFHVINPLASRRTAWIRDWIRIIPPLAVVLLLWQAWKFIDEDLNITGDVLIVTTTLLQGLQVVFIAYAAFLFFSAAGETIVNWREAYKSKLNANLARLLARVLGLVVAAYVAIVGARRIGADIVPLLAGLGVGGLAVALAAQKTLANFIGSVMLLTDKPVRQGDLCRFGDDKIGTVEKIGLNSTRIRTLERTVVTIPNADFADMQIDNFARRDQRLFKTRLQLRYETTPDQMRFLLIRLRELLLGHPKITSMPARVRFVGFGAFSKDVEIFAYFHCQDQNTFLAVQEDVLLRIEALVMEAGVGFAFPSQTAYLARDTGVDTEKGGQAEDHIQRLRATNKLPFPDFDEETADSLEDILDYPPKGSPEASR